MAKYIYKKFKADNDSNIVNINVNALEQVHHVLRFDLVTTTSSIPAYVCSHDYAHDNESGTIQYTKIVANSIKMFDNTGILPIYLPGDMQIRFDYINNRNIFIVTADNFEEFEEYRKKYLNKLFTKLVSHSLVFGQIDIEVILH